MYITEFRYTSKDNILTDFCVCGHFDYPAQLQVLIDLAKETFIYPFGHLKGDKMCCKNEKADAYPLKKKISDDDF